MRRVIAGLLAGLMLFTPVSPTFGDTIEIRGDLYNKLGLPRGEGPGDLTLFQGQLGGGLTPPVGVCGLNAASSLIAGLEGVANLGGLQGFINNWQSAGTALALYGLATFLPVAKEVLLGANMLSNFVAQLRGFSCAQAMEAIKEFNYQDSYLIKRCIFKRAKDDAERRGDRKMLEILNNPEKWYDVYRSAYPEQWYRFYRECLNSASLVDLLGGQDEANKYLNFISPRSLVRCYLGVDKTPTPDDIARADLQTRAKYFLYMVLPDISLDGRGLLRVRTVEITDRNGQRRPATMIDVVNLHVEHFVEDYKKLIEDLKGVIKFDMDHNTALQRSKPYFEAFERKYGINVEDMAPALIMVLRMRDYLQQNKDKGATYAMDLYRVDLLLEEYVMKIYLDKALQRLEMALDEYLARLKHAEAMRRSLGSGAIPGANDGCFGRSSGGST